MRRLQLITMTDDPDAQVRIAAFHALASDRDAHVRAMAAELAGKFVHTDSRAVTALETAHAPRHHLPADHPTRAQATGKLLVKPPVNGHVPRAGNTGG